MVFIKYDIDHKVYLEPHGELARKRDTLGRGNLSAKEAAALTRNTLDLQEDKSNIEKEIRTLKRCPRCNYLLVSLFGIGTIVASVYAVFSCKETHTTQYGYLVSNTSGETITTTEKGYSKAVKEMVDPQTNQFYFCFYVDKTAEIWHGNSVGSSVQVLV